MLALRGTVMSMDYIRGAYGVPAKRGGRVRFCDSIGGDRDGRIVGSRGQYLRVRLDGETWTRTMHPTWRIEYLLKTPNAEVTGLGRNRSSNER